MTPMWFAEPLCGGPQPWLHVKTASDLRKRECDRGHADPI
jgi:hypothetical protein